MLYLTGAFLSSALVTIVMKAGRPHIRSNAFVLAVNYLTCLLLSLLFVGPVRVFPRSDGLVFTLLLGITAGFCYVGTYMLLQWNIAKNGAVLSAAFMKLGVLVPTVLAVCRFGEKPGILQLLGFVLSVTAILLINLEKGTGVTNAPARTQWMLVVLLLAGGSCDGFSKIYEVYGAPALSNHFLLYLFFTAFLFCMASCFVKREHPAAADSLYGVLIGVPNYFSTRFLLLALSDVPAVIAYPTYSVSAILTVTAAGILFFKEKLSKQQLLALLLILAALVLLNV